MAPAVPTYAPRDPSGTVLYHVIAEHLETFLASLADDPEATGLPAYVDSGPILVIRHSGLSWHPVEFSFIYLPTSAWQP